MPFKYSCACGVSFTKCKIIGADMHIKREAKIPHANDIFNRRMPYRFPFSKFPAPSSLPIIIPAALEIPALKQHMISLTTAATELAAAASVPR